MLMLLAISIYSSLEDSGYSFEKTTRYSKCTESSQLAVRFCFNPEDSFDEIEKRAEKDWLDLQQQLCTSQLSRKQALYSYFDSSDDLQNDLLQKKLSSLDLSSCNILKSLKIPIIFPYFSLKPFLKVDFFHFWREKKTDKCYSPTYCG
jgi:hypothetical protein